MDEDTGGPGKSFDQRLRDARTRRGMDPVPAQPDGAAPDAIASDATAPDATGPDATGMAVVFRVGAELVSALLVGLAIGWTLDHFLGTRPLFLILFLLLGGVAGIINVWRLVALTPATGHVGRH